MKTNFLGLDLKNPVIIAAGPWNRDGQSIKKCLESGAAAAVTETIVTDAIRCPADLPLPATVPPTSCAADCAPLPAR